MSAIGTEHGIEGVRGVQHEVHEVAVGVLRDLGRERFFHFMRQLAELTKTAGGRIAFESVHGTPDVAYDLRVVRLPLQFQSFVIQRLQEFLRALEEQVPEFSCPLVGEECHVTPQSSGMPYRYSRCTMLKFVAQTEKTFRVSYKEIPIGIQAPMKFVDQTSLLRFVEIDHHVAAEDHVIVLRKEFRLQIMKVEMNEFFQCAFHDVAIADFVEVTQTIGVIHGLHLGFGITAFLRGAQHAVTDIRCQQLHPPREEARAVSDMGFRSAADYASCNKASASQTSIAMV